MRLSTVAPVLAGCGAAASSTLFSGATIIAFDTASNTPSVMRNGALLVTDDRIAALFDSPTPSPASLPADTESVDATDQIITPGFIDTHRHGWQTAFKTLASNTTLGEYFLLYGPFGPSSTILTPRDVYLGQMAGLYESLAGGVTTSLDHAHGAWSAEHAVQGAQACVDSHARVFYAPALTSSLPGYPFAQQLHDYRALAESGLLDGSPSELAVAYDEWSIPGTAAEARQVLDLVNKVGAAAVTVHALGGPWLITNLPSELDRMGALNDSNVPFVFSHASHLQPSDAAVLRRTGHTFSITPESEMHYGHGNPNSHLALDVASLGVDTHCTFSSDILSQARLWLQAVRQRVFDSVLGRWHVPAASPMGVAQAFHLATRAGGLALRRDDLGVIRVGAKADLVVWNARESPAMLGWNDPIAAVVLHASVGDVLDVMVDGRFVKRDGRMLAEGYHEVRREFRQSAKAIQDKWLAMPRPVLEGQWMGAMDLEHPADIGDGLYGPLQLQGAAANKKGDGKEEL